MSVRARRRCGVVFLAWLQTVSERTFLLGLASFLLGTVTAILALAPSSVAATTDPSKLLVFGGRVGLTAAVLEPRLLRLGG